MNTETTGHFTEKVFHLGLKIYVVWKKALEFNYWKITFK